MNRKNEEPDEKQKARQEAEKQWQGKYQVTSDKSFEVMNNQTILKK